MRASTNIRYRCTLVRALQPPADADTFVRNVADTSIAVPTMKVGRNVDQRYGQLGPRDHSALH